MPFCAGGGWKGHDILAQEKIIIKIRPGNLKV